MTDSKICIDCSLDLPLIKYQPDKRISKDGPGKGRRSSCGECCIRKLGPEILCKGPCNTVKDIDLFHKRGQWGKQTWCKDCRILPSERAKRKAYYETDEGNTKAFERFIRNRYGLLLTEWKSMLEKQDYACALCGGANPGRGNKRLAVDHDHITLEVRALLCHQCNFGLGAFKDNPEVLEKAAEYIRFHKTKAKKAA